MAQHHWPFYLYHKLGHILSDLSILIATSETVTLTSRPASQVLTQWQWLFYLYQKFWQWHWPFYLYHVFWQWHWPFYLYHMFWQWHWPFYLYHKFWLWHWPFYLYHMFWHSDIDLSIWITSYDTVTSTILFVSQVVPLAFLSVLQVMTQWHRRFYRILHVVTQWHRRHMSALKAH